MTQFLVSTTNERHIRAARAVLEPSKNSRLLALQHLPTLLHNGNGEQVAHLYRNMPGGKLFMQGGGGSP